MTGTFVGGTAYTFTIAATNKFGTGTASSVSNSVTPFPAYTLSQTFNASGNFTVPTGVTLMAIVGRGSGGGGAGSANVASGGPGAGGGGGGGVIYRDISDSSAQT